MVPLTTQNMIGISNKLGMDIREGKHTNARLVIGGIAVVSTCWPHGKKEIPKGTANKILRHQFLLGTDVDAYALRDCNMKLPEYIEHLKKNLISEFPQLFEATTQAEGRSKRRR